MKRSFITTGRTFVALNLALIALIVGVVAIFSWPATPASHAQDNSGPAYLPVQMAPVPTPTPGPPPQFVNKVDLPVAECPNSAGFNEVSGYMYIANIYSDNVSIFHRRSHVVTIPTGEWPRSVASDPNSPRTWVTNMHDGVSLIEGTVVTGLVPPDHEPYAIAFNPTNGYVYVTDLDSKIQVIDGAQLVTTLRILNPDSGKTAGWLLSIVVDPYTGLVYASGLEDGRLYVIKGTEVIDSVQLGAGPLNMAFDHMRGLIYVTHAAPNDDYPHDISVVDVKTLNVSFVDPIPGKINKAQDVAVDVISGLAYVTNPKLGTVTVLDGTRVVGMVDVGKQPWGIGVNPNDGYVFVTNRESDDVSILRNGVLLDTVDVKAEDPFAVGVDTINNDIYIANRGRRVASDECKYSSVTILH